MSTTQQNRIPEEILIATFSQLGTDVRLSDDERLAAILNEAASEENSIFRPFRWHEQYRYSEQLAESLQNLDCAGSITRENASQMNFQVSLRTTGPYGQSIFDSLDPASKELVMNVVEKLKATFGES